MFLLIFFPVFILVYYWLRAKYNNLTKWWVVAASIVFYAPFGLQNLAVLAASVVLNGAVGYLMIRRTLNGTELKQALLFLSLVYNLVSLLFFKFSGVFFPIAISFYTFNQLSFVVDAYRGDIREFGLVDYLCYILFFPKLLQGPLVGYGEFRKELERAVNCEGFSEVILANEDCKGRTLLKSRILVVNRQAQNEMILRGLFLFSMGLFKKVILADTFGKAVDYGFENISGLGSLEAVLVAVFYSFQLYFDFSGYCDMAAGVSGMMGFALPINFDSPYKAVNIIDFWKRWHITLTKFFTKYVYIPLGGNRKGEARMYINFMIVFLLSGLWHGSGWTFIVWGAMHGVLYVVTRMVQQKVSLVHRALDAVCVLATFVYVTLAWVFFRAGTVGEAISLIGRMFTGGHRHIATQLSSCFQLDELWYVIKVTPIMKLSFAWESCMWLFLIAAVGMIFFSSNAITIAKRAKIGVGTTLITAILMVWSVVSFAGVSTFLYMNF